MTFIEFSRAFAEATGRTYTESKEICNSMKDLIMSVMQEGESIEVNGFGALEPFSRTPHKVKNFDQEWIMTKPKKLVRFRIGQKFIDELNPPYGESSD